jgi:AcrR family transcriptional regulator
MITEMKKRKYTLRRRAEQQEATRRRIVEATVALHEELGPKDTTISAIAEKAGVQRLTVYRHFPDDLALFEACTSHWLVQNPPPSPREWEAESDPVRRTRLALTRLYQYYRRTERMWTGAYRDLDDVPALQPPMRGFEEYLEGIRDDLLAVRVPAPGDSRRLRAVLGHGIRFSTWRSLRAEGLPDAEMAQVVTGWVGQTPTVAAAPPPS